MLLTATVHGSGSGATVSGALKDARGATIWSGALTASGTADEYQVIIDPSDLQATLRTTWSYALEVTATYGGRTLEFVDDVSVKVRRS